MFVLVFLLSLTVVGFAALMLHEAAHAMIATVLRMPVRELKIGSGPGFRIETRPALHISIFPTGGHCKLYPVLSPRPLSMFLFTAAGPASDALLLIAVVSLASWDMENSIVLSAEIAAFIFLAGILVINLWPHQVVRDGRVFESDGAKLLSITRGIGVGGEFYRNYLALLSRYGDVSTFKRSTRSSCRIAWHLYAQYLEGTAVSDDTHALRRLLSEELGPAERLAVYDAIISRTLFGIGNCSSSEMDTYSADAYALAPNCKPIKASRGSVLIELDRCEEGLTVLREARDSTPFNDCVVQVYEALGHAKSGRPTEAWSHFAEARDSVEISQWSGIPIIKLFGRLESEISALAPKCVIGNRACGSS